MSAYAFPWPKLGSIVDEDDIQAVTEVMRQSMTERKSLKGDKLLVQFERAFADYVGTQHAIAINSCGTALAVVAKVIGLGAGDEAITTPNTHLSTATSVLQLGAKPVFADIDPRTLNIDPARIREKITNRTKAIFPVHYAGLPADMEAILELAHRHHLVVVEDAAHASGAEYKGRKIGSIGDVTCFSFQAQKNMTTLGEGGMITTDNDEWAKRIRLMRSFGTQRYPDQPTPWEPWHYDVVAIGTNLRMIEVQAAMGLTQLRKLDWMNELRREKAAYLSAQLQGIPGVTVPEDSSDRKHVYHIYNLFIDHKKAGFRRLDFLKTLRERYHVHSVIHYKPVYLFTLFRQYGYQPGLCPVAERMFEQIVGIPIHPSYTDKEMEYLAEAIRNAVMDCTHKGPIA